MFESIEVAITRILRIQKRELKGGIEAVLIDLLGYRKCSNRDVEARD